MKCTLTLDLLLGPERNLLAQLATHLGDLRIVPESFIWTVLPGSNEARLWLVLDTEVPRLELLAASFRDHPRIRQVRRTTTLPESADAVLRRLFPLEGGI